MNLLVPKKTLVIENGVDIDGTEITNVFLPEDLNEKFSWDNFETFEFKPRIVIFSGHVTFTNSRGIGAFHRSKPWPESASVTIRDLTQVLADEFLRTSKTRRPRVESALIKTNCVPFTHQNEVSYLFSSELPKFFLNRLKTQPCAHCSTKGAEILTADDPLDMLFDYYYDLGQMERSATSV